MRLIFFTWIIVSIAAMAQIVDLNILPAGTKKAGDHVTVECSVMPYVLHDTLRLSLVTKGVEREICTNMVLSNLFASSSRYEVKMAQDGDKVTLTLDITGTLGLDFSLRNLNFITSKYFTSMPLFVFVYNNLLSLSSRCKCWRQRKLHLQAYQRQDSSRNGHYLW